MSRTFRQSQSFLHTWSGLLLGWLLFIVFAAGTIAFWREGLNRWMRPELARIEQPMQVLHGAQAFLAHKAPDAKNWYINIPTAQSAGAQLFWQPQPKHGEAHRRRGRRDTQALIGADGNPVVVRETRGGDFFYRLHFDLHYMPVIWARWIVGFATAMMLVAILSGIVTHKKIFKDFFTLRRNKGQRSWLDGHNATAVLALPFHLMITYTGLVTLMAMLMPWAVVANYADAEKIYAVVFPEPDPLGRSGVPAPLVDLRTVVRDAESRFGAPAGNVSVSEPGDRSARIMVTRAEESMLSTRPPRLSYDGVSGRLLWQSPEPGAASVTAGAMVGLHAGRYADVFLRWVYFLCGVAGTLMVVSGLILWTVKRREKLPDPAHPHFGFRLVERLNIVFIAGFPLGVATMFWANRLLPTGLAGRADWEIHCLFLAWAAALPPALALRPAKAWAGLLALTGALLVALPVYNMAGTRRGIFAALAEGDLLFAGVDLTLLLFGIAFLAVARRTATYRPPERRQRRQRAQVAAPAAELEPAE